MSRKLKTKTEKHLFKQVMKERECADASTKSYSDLQCLLAKLVITEFQKKTGSEVDMHLDESSSVDLTDVGKWVFEHYDVESAEDLRKIASALTEYSECRNNSAMIFEIEEMNGALINIRPSEHVGMISTMLDRRVKFARRYGINTSYLKYLDFINSDFRKPK